MYTACGRDPGHKESAAAVVDDVAAPRVTTMCSLMLLQMGLPIVAESQLSEVCGHALTKTFACVHR